MHGTLILACLLYLMPKIFTIGGNLMKSDKNNFAQ